MLQRTWKPDRDWNWATAIKYWMQRQGCNELENPIGIETSSLDLLFTAFSMLQRTWKPDRDWNWSHEIPGPDPRSGCNELENPIGIETGHPLSDMRCKDLSCNELENPIGIETMASGFSEPGMLRQLQRTWKPDRDWNWLPGCWSTPGSSVLQRTWKPDRDWNHLDGRRVLWLFCSCNELENPIGIETACSERY